jgi:hypothetical protein
MINFCRRFIKGCSVLAQPLTCLTGHVLLDVDSAAQRAGYTHSILIFVIRNYLVLLCNYFALLFRSTKVRHCAFQKWVADSDPKILVGPHHP